MLAPRLQGSSIGRIRYDLWLNHWWYRPRPTWHVRPRPVELRSINCGQFDDGNFDQASGVDQFRPQRVAKAADGMLSPAIGCLERNSAICQRGTDLNDDAAIATAHVLQRRHC